MTFFKGFVERWRARGDFERRVAQFRQELMAARQSKQVDAVAALTVRRDTLGLTEDDVALELELIDALVDSWRLKAGFARGHAIPTVETQHRAIGAEACYFLASVCIPDSQSQETGKLFFTASRCVFAGGRLRSLGWRKIRTIRDEDRDLLIAADGDVLRFRCNTYTDTLRGVVIGRWLASAGADRRPLGGASSAPTV